MHETVRNLNLLDKIILLNTNAFTIDSILRLSFNILRVKLKTCLNRLKICTRRSYFSKLWQKGFEVALIIVIHAESYKNLRGVVSRTILVVYGFAVESESDMHSFESLPNYYFFKHLRLIACSA